MKRFLVCLPKLMLVILFVLQSTLQPLQNSLVNSLEYSVEERIYIVQKSLVRDQPQQLQHDHIQQHQHQQQPSNSGNQLHPQNQQQYHKPNNQYLTDTNNHDHQQLQQSNIDPTKQQYRKIQEPLHNQHYQQRQEQQPHHHQQQQLHQSLANNMQQVLMDAVVTRHQHNQYQYTQFQLKHESTHGGELSEFYYNNIESSSYPIIAQDQLTYYHQYNRLEQHQQQQDQHQHEPDLHQQYLHERHIVAYSGNSNEDDHQLHYNDDLNLPGSAHIKSQSCDSHHYESSNILMRNDYSIEEPTCKAPYANTAPQNHHVHYNEHPLHHHDQFHNQQHNIHQHPHSHHQSNEPVPTFSQFSHNNNNHHNKQSHNSNVESFPLTTHQYHYESSLLAAIRHYWREVSGLCLASAIFLNWLFVVIKRRFISSGLTRAEHAMETIQHATGTTSSTTSTTIRSVSKDTSSSIHDSAFEEIACPISLDDIDNSKSSHSLHKTASFSLLNNVKPSLNISTNIRQRSSTLKAEAKNSIATNNNTTTVNTTAFQPTDPISIPAINTSKKGIVNNLSSSPGNNSSISTSFTNSVTNNSEYNSRYSSDFDSIQRLGRGGFGVVFEARNKIDDCHYAVKRICLPLEKEARERVMREVRALAKLDHAGIVRYYNAWLETPPDEWLKQHDAQLGINNSKDGMSFPSTDGIYDRNESELNIRGGDQLNSGDNLSGLLFGQKNSLFNNKRRNQNGLNRFLRNNSSSPSLDIVFEGSGSIRLESENNTEKTNSSKNSRSSSQDDITEYNIKREIKENNYGDNNTISDSEEEDSDFIQFETKVNKNSTIDDITTSGNSLITNGCDVDYSMASQLSDPFSSSSSSSERNGCNSSRGTFGDKQKAMVDKEEEAHSQKGNNIFKKRMAGNNRVDLRKNALNYQKELRQFNNASLAENIHVEKVYLYIQMQLCRKDTLKDWLKTNCDNRDKTTIFDLFYQIVDAVEYVHSQDLIHRDLKPSNIFFSLDGTLKIGDFGLCRAKTSTGIGSSLDLQEYVAESDVERGFEAVHTEQVGTQLYMSPEQLNGLSYNQKVDIFAMGLILLELLVPFKTQMQRVNVLFKARNNLYSDEFKTEHPNEHELVKSLLSRSPQKRPTASVIKQHDLLANAQLSQPVIERIYHRRRTISSNSSTE